MKIFGIHITTHRQFKAMVESWQDVLTDADERVVAAAAENREYRKAFSHAKDHADRLAEALYLTTRGDYAKADGTGVVVNEQAVQVYEERLRWARGGLIELQATITCMVDPIDMAALYDRQHLEFRGLKWKLASSDARREMFRWSRPGLNTPDSFVGGPIFHTLTMVAFAAPDAAGFPKAYDDPRFGLAAVPPDLDTLAPYDAGLLGGQDGNDAAWWHDYMRAELARAHDFYQSQLGGAA